MNIIKRLEWRWEHFGDPLPGEIEPTTCGSDTVRCVWMSHAEDAERSLLARRLRGLLTGYGEGWTLRAALIDWVTEPLARAAEPLLAIVLAILLLPIFILLVLMERE